MVGSTARIKHNPSDRNILSERKKINSVTGNTASSFPVYLSAHQAPEKRWTKKTTTTTKKTNKQKTRKTSPGGEQNLSFLG